MIKFPAAAAVLSGIFLVFLATTVAGALLAALSTRVIRSVCGLALCCLGLAGLYYFLHSPFLALMELLIYVGAVCVTIVFAIMLAEPDESRTAAPRAATAGWSAAALFASGGVFWGLARLAGQVAWAPPPARLNDGSVPAVGRALLTTHSLTFELISVVLLVAILGALVIARPGRSQL